MNVNELFRKENNSILYRFLGDPKRATKQLNSRRERVLFKEIYPPL